VSGAPGQSRDSVTLGTTGASGRDAQHGAREAGATEPPARRRSSGRLRTWLRRAVVIALVVAGAFVAFEYATRIQPPALPPPADEPLVYDGTTTRVGSAYLARRGALWVMQLAGAPAVLGYRHARLATPLMAAGDARMLELFGHFVPSAALRSVITAIVRARYRSVDRAFPEARRAELFGEAHGYADRFAAFLPTYHRLVYLHALYDIALAFERSPLLGCTAFVASGAATEHGATPGHTIVGRNFDFDLDPWFDEDKVVQIVAPAGRIPFVSVAWPGMTGVVTGMNAEGLWVSVNGGRAGELDSTGVPVVFTTRTVLEEARSLDAAIALIARDAPMVSHILLLADGKTGESAIVERAPGRPLGIVREASTAVLANHYRTAPLKDDPKDAYVRDHTSTLAREARMREMVARHHGRIDPAVAATILRDRGGVADVPLPPGNKNALNAIVATHSVIADLTDRVLWVSEGPHSLGRYRRIDLAARLAGFEGAAESEGAGDLPEDPSWRDGSYDRFLMGARLRREAEAARAAGQNTGAVDAYRRALALRADDHLAWWGLAEVTEQAGDRAAAHAAWERVLALAPETPAAEQEARRRVQATGL
jgi:tetratricopeptide (TPR) repeat protein